MTESIRLSSEERTFFALVAKAVFVNPFSPEREELDRALTGEDDALPRTEVLPRVQQRLDRHLTKLQASGPVKLNDFAAADRDLMRSVFLFDVYHRGLPRLDELIQKQIQAPGESLPVPFARRVIRELIDWGFNSTAAEGYFALFNQVRRAYYFIDRGLVGRSPCMHQLRERLWNNVFTRDIAWYERYMWSRMEDFSTLLLGETGTGKGSAAAAIGRSGLIPFDPRQERFTYPFTQTFISINLAQYPETLIESELFGHRKGAFTGAIDHHEGLLRRCSSRGAVFLDEVGEVPLSLQVKLLRVLQERSFNPVGSHDTETFRGRVIAATNKALDEERAAGRFRDDFYYRLCSDLITVPPLRQRLAEEERELDDLLDHIVTRLTGNPEPSLSREIKDKLLKHVPAGYAWPGNVRELEQAVRRIFLTGSYEGDHRPAPTDRLSTLMAGIRRGNLPARDLLAHYCAMLYERHGTYEAVGDLTELDRRTVKKYIESSPG